MTGNSGRNIHGFIMETPGGFRVFTGATSSVVANELLLRRIVKVAGAAKGMLLDVGSGDRPYYGIFGPRVAAYVGMDLPGSGHPDKPAVHGDAHFLPFSDDTFDTVLCSELLEHCPRPWQVLEEIRRVLRPGGRVILSAPQTYRLHSDPHDYYRFTREGLIQLVGVDCGLKIESIEPVGGTVDFAVDFCSKLVSMIGEKVRFVPSRATKFLSVLLQVGYLRLRGRDSNDEAFTLGHVLVATKEDP